MRGSCARRDKKEKRAKKTKYLFNSILAIIFIMDEFKLKIILSALGGILFALVFILLAFVLPPEKEKVYIKKKANKLEKVSQAVRERLSD